MRGPNNMQDVWGKLWDIALGEAGSPPATIIIDEEDPGSVLLRWSDGSTTALWWHDGDWQINGSVDAAPCDVAARDSF